MNNEKITISDIRQSSEKFFNCSIIYNEKEKIEGFGKMDCHEESQKMKQLKQTPLGKELPNLITTYSLNGKEYIIMENLKSNFTSPCFLDVKLGYRTWDIGVSEEVYHKLLERSCVSTSQMYGMRLDLGEYWRNGKLVLELTKGNLGHIPIDWVCFTIDCFMPLEIRIKVHSRIVEITNSYKEMLKQYPNFRMYSGSLIICYDSDHLDFPPRVNLIDFAHTHLDVSQDGGNSSEEFNDHVIDGLINLCKFTANNDSPYIGHYFQFLTDTSSDEESEEESNIDLNIENQKDHMMSQEISHLSV